MFCTVRSHDVDLHLLRNKEWGKSGVQVFTICPGSCPRLGHLPWDPYVCVSPWQLHRAYLMGPGDFRAGSASGRTRTVGRPGHRCWSEGQRWNLGMDRKSFNMFLPSLDWITGTTVTSSNSAAVINLEVKVGQASSFHIKILPTLSI